MASVAEARRLLGAAALLAAAATLSLRGAPAPADPRLPSVAADRAEVCPWCDNDPALLAAAGLVSHGPFPYAAATSDEAQTRLPYAKIRFLESAHHRFGSILGAYTVPERESKKIRAELKELKEFFPKIDEKARHLDPWLRLHLTALRCEKFYAFFLEIMGLKESDFPDGTALYNPTGGTKYMGEGRFLGQKDKYDLYLADSLAQYQDLLVPHFGLATRKPQRWNVIKRDALFFGLWAKDDNLINDTAIHCCLVHNLAHNYLDGFRHYSYDLPVWLTEGFAHWCQRRVDPGYVNYDNIEGSAPLKQNGEGWPQDARRIAQRDRAAPLPDLIRKNSFAELDQTDHIVIWAKIDFLIATDRAKFAAFVDRLKGRLDTTGHAMSKGLPDEQRKALQDLYGWTYAEFETAWKAWVLEAYSAKPDMKGEK